MTTSRTTPEDPRYIAQGIAHDFNNILGLVKNHLNFLEHDITSESRLRPRVKEDFDVMRSQIIQGERLSRALMTFSQAYNPVPVVFDLNTVVEENKTLMTSLSAIEVEYDLADDLALIEADKSQIQRVLWNLVINARDAMGNSGGTINIATGNYVDGDGLLYACLYVSDDGPGITSGSRIFEPFVTTKEGVSGTAGWGLPIVQGIVRHAGGTITCVSQLGVKTIFRVDLPAEHPA